MRDGPAEPEIYAYRPYRRFQATALLVLAVGLALVLANSPVYTRELTLGTGMVVSIAVLLGLSWDLKELWWIWMLLLAGGAYRLFLAVHEKRRHQMRRCSLARTPVTPPRLDKYGKNILP